MGPPSNDDDSFVCFFIPHSFFKSIDRSEKGPNRSMPWQNLSDLDFVDLRCADLAPSNRRVPGCPEGFNGGGRESRRRLLNNMGWVKHIAIGSMGLILFHYIWLQLIFFHGKCIGKLTAVLYGSYGKLQLLFLSPKLRTG